MGPSSTPWSGLTALWEKTASIREKNEQPVYEIDLACGKPRVFATGLRNPNGMTWRSETGMLWTVVNERDELGSDLVPDYRGCLGCCLRLNFGYHNRCCVSPIQTMGL